MSHSVAIPNVTGTYSFKSCQHPIFIIGIKPRSGTNYLNNLLLTHPDVRSPGIVWEDYFLRHADLLAEYAQHTQISWKDKWATQLQTALGNDAMLRHLGDGLIRLMEEQYRHCVTSGSQRPPSENTPVALVTATPNTRNLSYFPSLFPAAATLLIVRDGRATVESGVQSFGWDYEDAIRSWVISGQRILDFCARQEYANRHLLLHYETLFQHTRSEMRRVFDFLALDCSRYDFSTCDTLGVMGSSELVQSGTGKLHWSYVDTHSDFNPLARAAHWPKPLNRRFAYLAGRTMTALGYDISEPQTNQNNEQDYKWNIALDVLYVLEIKLRRHFPAASRLIRRTRNRLLHVPSSKQPD